MSKRSKPTFTTDCAASKFQAVLDAVQGDLFEKAKQRMKGNSVTAESIGELESILNEVTAEKGGGNS